MKHEQFIVMRVEYHLSNSWLV